MAVQSLVRRERLPYLILLIALLMTAATARYAYISGTLEDELEFEKSVESVAGTLSSRIGAYVAMLLGGAGLFAASDEVTVEEFRAYVARLDLASRYPGVQGIGFARLIKATERQSLLAELGAVHPGFRFWPEPAAGDFTAIVYLEPRDARNIRALGFDMSSEVIRREAMWRARDGGQPAATGPVTLVQEAVADGPRQTGFLIYVPVYEGGPVPLTLEGRRRALRGFVYSPFRAGDLLSSAIGSDLLSTLHVGIFDGAVEAGRQIHELREGRASPRFTAHRRIDVGGRDWVAVVQGGASRRLFGTQIVVGLVVAGGTMLSLLVFHTLRNQVRARVAAERAAEELRTSEERLRVADREKDAFLAVISHELRTPLNAIVGWASMLGRGSVPEHTQAHAISVIKRNAAAQTRLIEDLLDMSRAVAGHLDLRLTEVDVKATLDAAIDSVRHAAQAARLTLELRAAPGLGVIEADAGRLQQVVTNLLSNAIKFTPAGGRISVSADRTGGAIVITVADTGIGIAPEFVPFLFDRFKQADSSTTRAHSGAGLGLAIVRHLVQLHHGTIEAASAGTDCGASFTVRLPVSRRRKLA